MRNKFVSLQALALLVIFCLTGSLTRAAVRNRLLSPNSNNGREKTVTSLREKTPESSALPKIPNY